MHSFKSFVNADANGRDCRVIYQTLYYCRDKMFMRPLCWYFVFISQDFKDEQTWIIQFYFAA